MHESHVSSSGDEAAALVRSASLATSAHEFSRIWQKIAAEYAAAERVRPADHRLAANRGHALWIADRHEESLTSYKRAVQLAPNDPVVYRGLGNALVDRQAFEAADRAYRRSASLGGSALSRWNRSQVLIGLEQYVEAYALAEQRWLLPAIKPWRDPTTAWRGEAEGWDAPLLVWSEQGLGDTLQHLRWLGPLQKRRSVGAPLLLEVESCLVELLQQRLAGLDHRPLVRAKPAERPGSWDGAHISLLSLPTLLGGAPIPSAAAWLQSQPRFSNRPQRIGLVWAAGRKCEEPVAAREYWRRSLDGDSLGALIEGVADLGIEVVLLQFGADRDQADPWRHCVAAELPGDADFAATSSYLETLDLVITVDTAMAHLLGAMRFPGWVLLPFSAAPRWLRGRHDTPWYPSLRLFRQPFCGDWSAVVLEVLCALQSLGRVP